MPKNLQKKLLIIKKIKIMENKTFMFPPIGGKSILRSTGEEVEVIDFEAKERGDSYK